MTSLHEQHYLDLALEAYIDRLVSRYGLERAEKILAGRDPDFNEDLAKWRNLGRRK